MLISLYAQTVIYVRSIKKSSADADNRRDAFSGQPRSPNIVPFHILGIVSYCAIVTWSFRRAPFTIIDLNKCRDLEIGVRDHSMSLKVATFDRLCGFLLVFLSNFVPKTHRFLRYLTCKYAVTLKPGSGVTQGHRKLYHKIRHPRLPINVP